MDFARLVRVFERSVFASDTDAFSIADVLSSVATISWFGLYYPLDALFTSIANTLVGLDMLTLY